MCEFGQFGLAIVAFEYPKCFLVVVFVLQEWEKEKKLVLLRLPFHLADSITESSLRQEGRVVKNLFSGFYLRTEPKWSEHTLLSPRQNPDTCPAYN